MRCNNNTDQLRTCCPQQHDCIVFATTCKLQVVIFDSVVLVSPTCHSQVNICQRLL